MTVRDTSAPRDAAHGMRNPDLSLVPSNSKRFPTRVLLTCAVFAGVQALLWAPLASAAAAVAIVAPPVYAVVAGAHSVMVFAARRYTGVAGAATLTALLAGFLVAAFSPIGFLVIIPFVCAGAAFDLGLLLWHDGSARESRSRMRREIPYFVAATLAAATLFAISLAVFSPEHLSPLVLAATLAGRLVGEGAAAVAAGAVVSLLGRAGVRAHDVRHTAGPASADPSRAYEPPPPGGRR